MTRALSQVLGLLCILIFAVGAQAQVGSSQVESISAGALIIAMDNDKQGDGPGCSNSEAFNLRAYGLAVRLLHNNIPLKWAIENKASKDGVDFVADASRITGTCQDGGVNTSFSGGPLIITQEYAALALPVITAFNGEITGSGNDVRVYQANSGFTAPIRYTLTHKPRIAIGPDGGGFGNAIHQTLFDNAKLRDAANNPYYANVNNENIQPTSCYTIATQPHAADTAINFIDEYRAFAESGGNLQLQCYSVDLFENNAAFGRFVSTAGWSIFGTNPSTGSVDTPLVFPNPAMPFNQFIGNLANQDGRVTEFSLAAGSSLRPNSRIAVRNSTPTNENKYVAAVTQIGFAPAGGNVFELGGHSYYRNGTGEYSNTELERLNGQRMILNTLLVPVTRPSGCGLAIPSVQAFKTVRMFTDPDSNNIPAVNEVVEWTISYINNSAVPVANFQIADVIDAKLQFQSIVVSASAGSTAAADPSYNGTVANQNMLANGAILAAGGQIVVKLRTKVLNIGEILNQSTGTGSGIVAGGVKSDTADATTPGSVAGYPIAGDCANAPVCLSQTGYQTNSNSDPTGFAITISTAAPASITGRVVDATGRGISRAYVKLENATTGEVKGAWTNSFGYYILEDLTVGEFYTLSVQAKRYRFAQESVSFSLNESLSDVNFTALSGFTQRVAEPPVSAKRNGKQ